MHCLYSICLPWTGGMEKRSDYTKHSEKSEVIVRFKQQLLIGKLNFILHYLHFKQKENKMFIVLHRMELASSQLNLLTHTRGRRRPPRCRAHMAGLPGQAATHNRPAPGAARSDSHSNDSIPTNLKQCSKHTW